MEQRSNGQIGQPAACMIENNRALSVQFGGRQGDFQVARLWPEGGLENPICRACAIAPRRGGAEQVLDVIGDIHRNCG
jgi:hypothetical protein